MARWSGSLSAKLALILFVFLIVPVIVYGQFKAADDDRRSLLLKLVQEQGLLIAQALRGELESIDRDPFRAAGAVFGQIDIDGLNIKLLFRPVGQSGPDHFYYVASTPKVSTDYLDRERAELINTGVLERIHDTCEGNRPLAARYTNPAGETEMLTSITPVNTTLGCWAVITARSTFSLLGSSIAQPYWLSAEIRIAAAIYFLMAILVVGLFSAVHQSIRRFGKLAQDIRVGEDTGSSFQALNRLPELDGVAVAFDSLVQALRRSSKSIREAAEENAHAFKTPIGTIRQSLEPLKRSVAADNQRGRRALEMLESSVSRLDTLVMAARRLEEAAAEAINPAPHAFDLSMLLEQMAQEYRRTAEARRVSLVTRFDKIVQVSSGAELIETAVENLVENALDFAPIGSTVSLIMRKIGKSVEIVVADQGPGVAPELLSKVFQRYFSHRPGNPDGDDPNQHFGIGLWVVRRNIEALGGSVRARNLTPSGLEITLVLPIRR